MATAPFKVIEKLVFAHIVPSKPTVTSVLQEPSSADDAPHGPLWALAKRNEATTTIKPARRQRKPILKVARKILVVIMIDVSEGEADRCFEIVEVFMSLTDPLPRICCSCRLLLKLTSLPIRN
jgi:hypothetical protein